ncbi:TetR/AcrR family transcriptional regulator [Phenylobacterium sp.]|uniref:TetR/AcrR family transcriptional regulator n=1 Tax=Phenylobacterium sp. TaxID=1871053 RepID=UPI0035B3EC2F
MRYTHEHKERSRARILREASQALRLGGPDRVVVADIMAAAGMTHGGFYVHFKSKDELIALAIQDGFEQVSERFDALTKDRGPAAALGAYIDAYLSQQHRDQRDQGCPAAALAGDAPRLKEDARGAFQAGFERSTIRISRWLADLGHDQPDELAISVMTEMIGALMAARACVDARASGRILRISRQALRGRLGLMTAA